jgi:hypothetical protein
MGRRKSLNGLEDTMRKDKGEVPCVQRDAVILEPEDKDLHPAGSMKQTERVFP